MGRTHGETVEQEWAYINLAALSTREMGPGARHSALDDSWGGWNWRKILGLGEYNLLSYNIVGRGLTVILGSLLNTNIGKAVEMALNQRKVATELSGTFTDETVQKWKEMVKVWRVDPSRPNPYVSNDRGGFSGGALRPDIL